MNRIIFFIVYVAIQTFLVAPLQGGGWVDAGGDLLKDRYNPWFFNNQKQVTYCVLVDKERFGFDADFLDKKIQQAVKYWRNEFPRSFLRLKDFGVVQVAHNQWIRKPDCENSEEADVNVRFLFGVKSKNQREFFEKSGYIQTSVAVRTDYDAKTMTGKGFIYLANGKEIDGRNTNIWEPAGGVKILLALVHELGHVFGLPHIGAGLEVMAEGYVESLLFDDRPRITAHKKSAFFRPPEKFKFSYTILDNLPKYFEVDRNFFNWQAVLDFEDIYSPLPIRIYDEYGNVFAQGVLKLDGVEFVISSRWLYIWLPKEQDIFTDDDLSQIQRQGIPYQSFHDLKFVGNLNFVSGQEKQIYLNFNQGSHKVHLTGIHAGEHLVLK